MGYYIQFDFKVSDVKCFYIFNGFINFLCIEIVIPRVITKIATKMYNQN